MMMALAMPTATAKMIRSAIELFPSAENVGEGEANDAAQDDQKEDHCALFVVVHVFVLCLVADGRVMQPTEGLHILTVRGR
jgi:hypothetical protein